MRCRFVTIVTGAPVETMEDGGESVTIESSGETRAHRWLIDRMSLVEIADAKGVTRDYVQAPASSLEPRG